ncbi:ATP-binding protein [Caballeronia sordidicola]|nr:ATP-binding protein [Caballeronia sordidicola]
MWIDKCMRATELSGVFDVVRALAATRQPNELFDTLIRALMNNSSASKGCLLLAEGSALRLAAHGERGDQCVNVRTSFQDASCLALPETILASVQRGYVEVILADAAQPNSFSNDFYFVERHVRSVACIPLIAHSQYLGLVYLEDDLHTDAFPDERVMFLSFLVEQAAISLEHARHCENLIKENKRLSLLQSDLAFQRNLLRTLAETFPHRIYAKDAQTRFIFGNMAVAQGMGVTSPDELLGKTDFGFYSEESAIRYYQDEMTIMESGRPLMNHEEETNYLLTGDMAWMLTTKVPLRDDDGKVIGIVGVNCDITERKQIEMELVSRNAELVALNVKLSQAQAQLLQSEKLASIGQLAAGVAHEINNPIGFILSNFATLDGYVKDLLALLDAYAQAEAFIESKAMTENLNLQKEIVDLPYLKDDIPVLVTQTKEGITRVRNIVQALTAFSRVSENSEWQFADLHHGIDATLNIVNSEIKYKADVIKDFGQIPEIECLPSEIDQVIMNLLVNAAQAIGERRGVITIRTRLEEEIVLIVISDTGCGIAEENLLRIFDPFYTTKPVGKGTGLGLSLAYGIVQKHNGTLEAESKVGTGTTFRLTLPVRHRHVEKASGTRTHFVSALAATQ